MLQCKHGTECPCTAILRICFSVIFREVKSKPTEDVEVTRIPRGAKAGF